MPQNIQVEGKGWVTLGAIFAGQGELPTIGDLGGGVRGIVRQGSQNPPTIATDPTFTQYFFLDKNLTFIGREHLEFLPRGTFRERATAFVESREKARHAPAAMTAHAKPPRLRVGGRFVKTGAAAASEQERLRQAFGDAPGAAAATAGPTRRRGRRKAEAPTVIGDEASLRAATGGVRVENAEAAFETAPAGAHLRPDPVAV